jgi:predicted RNA-binding protein with PIN domain
LEIELESARDLLLRDLQNYRSSKKIEIIVVFDGIQGIRLPRGHTTYRGIKIIFSCAPRKADPIIMDLIRKEKHKRSITVITNDREILQFAKRAGSHSLAPHDFYQRIKSGSQEKDMNNKFNGEMTPEELEEWKKIFKIK